MFAGFQHNRFSQYAVAYVSHAYNSTLPEKIKIAQVTVVFKSGDTSLMTNYPPIPIPVLPCFSKMLERIMYNRDYKYLTEKNLLYRKQFGFQKGHSPEYTILQLVEQIN